MALFLVVGAAHADYNSDAAARQAGEWIGSYGVATSGDILYLADYNTLGQPRANTLDIQSGSINSVELAIIPVVEDASGNVVAGWFASAADAENVAINHNVSTSRVTLGTPTGIAVPGSGYYCSITATAISGSELGPDSYRVKYNPNGAYGDFSLVITDLSEQDTGSVDNILIKFYDPSATTEFVSGDFSTVRGGDDVAIAGANGRSYATALDAVAHGKSNIADIFNDYVKYSNSQILETIIDANNNDHPTSPSYFWLYGIYISNGPGADWVRDDSAEVIGPDDYLLKEGLMVLWKLTDSYDPGTYDALFPATLP
jgi:hypothetical protein